MNANEPITLTRDVEGTIVPAGTRVTLQKGEQAHITQSLGDSYTIVVNGNMFRLAAKDTDALGIEVAVKPTSPSGQRRTREELEEEVWKQLKTCYDPEIPVNIVDLGLVYDCEFAPNAEPDSYRVDLTITLTAAGCGMGPVLSSDVQTKLLTLDEITEATCDVVFDPPWNQSMMSEAAQLQLGMF
jgi:probable FeS assembly SUF system protein SufT